MVSFDAKRIVLILESFPSHSELFYVNIFLGLLRKGWDVHVLCVNTNLEYLSNLSHLNQDLDIKRRIQLTCTSRSRWISILLYPKLLFHCLFTKPTSLLYYFSSGIKVHGLKVLQRLYRDLQVIALNPTLIHFETGSMAKNQVDLKELLGCKLVVSINSYDLNSSGLDKHEFIQSVCNQVDGIHYTREDICHHFEKHHCNLDNISRVIPPSIDTRIFDHREEKIYNFVGNPDRTFRILSIGRLEWYSGYEFALQAVRELVNRDIACEYRIVGVGPYLEALAFARHQLGLDNIVKFIDNQNSEQLVPHMLWADVFLFTSIFEDLSNKVLKAQVMCIPVVCTDSGGMNEIVLHGVTGFIAPKRDYLSLAEYLVSLQANPELCNRMGREGRRRVIKEFEIKDRIERFTEFYSKLISNENFN